MKKVLVDTSVWIDYFRGKPRAARLDTLIDENLIVTNELILSELLPSIHLKKERSLMEVMKSIEVINIHINWTEIQSYQIRNLKNGINNVGIPDLIILQNVIQNHLTLFTFDKHFDLMKRLFKFEIIP